MGKSRETAASSGNGEEWYNLADWKNRHVVLDVVWFAFSFCSLHAKSVHSFFQSILETWGGETIALYSPVDWIGVCMYISISTLLIYSPFSP